MMRRVLTLAVVAFAAAGLSDPAVSYADPVRPQADTACAPELDGALTDVDGSKTLLQCSDGRWKVYTDAYPSSDRWLSRGTNLTVSGQGRRNPEFPAGVWTATPQYSQTRCGAEQVEVIGAGQLGAPQTVAGQPGQPLVLAVSARLFKVTLTGHCLWLRSG